MSKRSYFEHGWSHSLVSQQTDSNSFEISEQCLVNGRMDPNLSSLENTKTDNILNPGKSTKKTLFYKNDNI